MSKAAANPENKLPARASRQPVRKRKRLPPRERLNERQTIFVECILLGMTGAAAVRKAGYTKTKSAYAAASDLRRNPKIKAAIAAGLREMQLSREEIIRCAERIVEANPKELFDENGGFNIAKLPDDLARAIKKIKPGEFGTEVQLHSPLEAATLLAKLHRLFGEFGDPSERGNVSITIKQLLQQAILPEGTTRQRIEAIDVVAAPVENARSATIEPSRAPADAKSTGADMAQGSKAAGGAGNGGTAATGVDDALVGLAGGVFGNGNGNGKPD